MRLAPITKLFLGFVLSLWAFPLSSIYLLLALLAVQFSYGALVGALRKSLTGLTGLLIGVIFVFLIQFFWGNGMEAGIVTSLKMLTMTIPFIILVSSTPVQDLSAALVRQCKVPTEYAFLLTSILRFIPDFIAEGKAIRQAQACRGFRAKKNVFVYISSFFAVVEPLVLGAVRRAETLAISLEMRGFGQGKGPVNRNLALKGVDYGLFLLMIVGSALMFSPSLLQKLIG
jgi:ABC-type cobalt transport system, permease component CbiQ and related transporters